MGFSLRVTCRKGTMAPNIWLLIMGPLAKCEIPTLSEWIRNKQEPPKGKVNLRRQMSRGGSADSPDQEIRKPGAESRIGVRTGWRLSQRTDRWCEGPSGQSSLKGSKSQTHEMLLSICFLYPLQTTKTWGENVVKSYLNLILHHLCPLYTYPPNQWIYSFHHHFPRLILSQNQSLSIKPTNCFSSIYILTLVIILSK